MDDVRKVKIVHAHCAKGSTASCKSPSYETRSATLAPTPQKLVASTRLVELDILGLVLLDVKGEVSGLWHYREHGKVVGMRGTLTRGGVTRERALEIQRWE